MGYSVVSLMLEKYFLDYFKIRDTIDAKISDILSFYKTDILCKKGCSGCCTGISLFSVEFFAIKSVLGQEDERKTGKSNCPDNLLKYLTLPESSETEWNPDCVFLENSICTIYEARPIICRTQGLPLLYFSDKLENYTISYCEKNFTSCNEDFEFNTEYAIDLDRLNSSLLKLNKEFMEAANLENNANKRIPISLLLS
ncbi:MAG: YkgJ family cysteine cluster protein [Spirochaetes bacterium]|nr:YkgJ family cysteine cluster protein [Spirochaetota bacterium]